MDGLDKIMQDVSLEKYKSAIAGISKMTNDRSLSVIKNMSQSSAAIALENSAFFKVQRDLQTIKSIALQKNTGYYTMAQGLTSVLENYNQLSAVTCVAKQLAETFQPLSAVSTSLVGMNAIANAISPISELSSMVIKNPSLLTCLHSALESQIDTSLWDYWDSTEELSDDDIDEEISEELVAIVGEENKESLVKRFVAQHGEKGKKILVLVLKWLVGIFLGGLLGSYFEPVYRILTPAFLRQEDSIECQQIEEIPVNTEIHVWGDITNNFIEISYSLDNKEYMGYISKEELENNSQKIANEIELEHICFINDVVEVLSENWNLDSETVYRFLKDDTNLLHEYLLEYYDGLCDMENEDLIKELEIYCTEKGIVIPKAHAE